MNKSDWPALQPGDILLTKSKTWLSWAIRWVESLETGQARVSHVALVLGDGLLIESLWKVSISEIKKYHDQPVVIYRLTEGIYSLDRIHVRIAAMKIAGATYGWLKIPLFALDAVSSYMGRLFGHKEPIYFFTSTLGITNFRVCSQFVMYVWEKAGGYKWPIPWKSGTPDFLDDYCAKNAKKIYEDL